MSTIRWEEAAAKWYDEKVEKGSKDLRNPKAKLDWLEPQLKGKALEHLRKHVAKIDSVLDGLS